MLQEVKNNVYNAVMVVSDGENHNGELIFYIKSA